MSNNRRNKYDKKDSLEIGDSAQDRFARAAKARGWQVAESSPDEDINDHWDFLLSRGERKILVDVKAMKRIQRSDSGKQDDLIWIELHSVRPYDNGWLYGKATHISFEMADGFVIVKRDELRILVESLVDYENLVESAKNAFHCIYSRGGRPDKLTLISKEELLTLSHAYWRNIRE